MDAPIRNITQTSSNNFIESWHMLVVGCATGWNFGCSHNFSIWFHQSWCMKKTCAHIAYIPLVHCNRIINKDKTTQSFCFRSFRWWKLKRQTLSAVQCIWSEWIRTCRRAKTNGSSDSSILTHVTLYFFPCVLNWFAFQSEEVNLIVESILEAFFWFFTPL